MMLIQRTLHCPKPLQVWCFGGGEFPVLERNTTFTDLAISCCSKEQGSLVFEPFFFVKTNFQKQSFILDVRGINRSKPQT